MDQSPSPFAVGAQIGRYRLIQQIGRGGMGEVFKAEDTTLGRIVAIKALPAEVVATGERLSRFEREGRFAAALSHPNLVQIHDVGEMASTPYIVQEFVDGESLEDVIFRGPVNPKQAASWCRQAALGLAAVHEAGIIHRDIKPGNIMIGKDGRVRVLDFGLATMEAGRTPEAVSSRALTVDGFILGTAQYMSPEQAMGKRLDARSDVFSLGSVLYELLTGRRPFGGQNPIDVLHAVIHADPLPLPLEIPDQLADLVDRALSKEPADRPKSMKDFARDLETTCLTPATFPRVNSAPVPERAPSPDRAVPVKTEQSHAETRPLADPVVAGRKYKIIALSLFALVCILPLLWWLSRAPQQAVHTPPIPVQLTASAGLDIFPSFSPDGTNIIYSSNRSGSFELYVRALAPGGREIQLTRDGNENLQPAWSPDGSLVAFHSKKKGGIWVMPALGGTARQVSLFGSRPAWSPNSKTIAFESGPLVDLSASYLGTLPPSVIWITSIDGSSPYQLTSVGRPAGGHGSPAFSPDGARVAFSSYVRAQSGEIWTVSLSSRNLIRIAKGPGFRLDPVFGLDGSAIYFCGVSTSWTYGVYRGRLDQEKGTPIGEAEELFNFGLGPVRQLALSPDGMRLAYSSLTMSSNLVSQQVSPVSGETVNSPVPITRETGRNSRPSFSPDSTRIAFTKWRLGSRLDVFVSNADGTNETQRTTHVADDDFPAWFPDGKRLAFISMRTGGYPALFSHDLTSGQDTLLADMGRGIDFVRLSPDGKSFTFHRAPEGGVINTFRAEIGTSNVKQITFDNEMAGFACWSPDGKRLALEVKRKEDVHVGLVPSDGGEITLLTRQPGQAWPYSFSPDGDRIAFAGFREGLWNVFWVSISKRQEKQLTSNTRLNAYLRYPAWSPRGDTVVYELAETTGNVWLLENFR